MSIALGRTHFVTVQGLWHLTCRFLSPASKPPIANIHDCNTSQMLECFRKRIKYHIYNLLHRIKNRFDDLQNEIRKKKNNMFERECFGLVRWHWNRVAVL